MPRPFRTTALLALALAASHASARRVAAQRIGAVRGTVFDSLTLRPLAGAVVEVSGYLRSAVADRNGRFRIDSVPAGMQRLEFSALDLDSVGLYGFARDVDVKEGADTRVDLATPSFAVMYARLCGPGATSGGDSAIVFGSVRNAAGGDRVQGARVHFSWFTVATDSGVRLVEATRSAQTGPEGDYGVCGLPSDLSLATRAEGMGRASGRVTTIVGDTRILRRDLWVSEEVPPTNTSVPARGTATVQGVVRDDRGRPIANALVVLSSADVPVRTGEAGQYRITSAPSGSHELTVRHVGLGSVTRIVELRPDQSVDVPFVLSKVQTLATMNVRGALSVGADRKGFLDRKRLGFGHFLDQKEIAKRADIGSVLARMPGLRVVRNGLGFTLEGGRSNCSPRVIIDGDPSSPLVRSLSVPRAVDTPVPSSPSITPLEVLNPRDILGVEYYPGGGGFIPLQYAMGPSNFCGTLMIWTSFARW